MNDSTGWEPIGPARLNRTLKAQALDSHNARTLARIARETGQPLPARIVGGAMAGGDARAMRGVPVQARGVGGTIRGLAVGALSFFDVMPPPLVPLCALWCGCSVGMRA